MLPKQEKPPHSVLLKAGAQSKYPRQTPSLSSDQSFTNSIDMENCMGTLHTSDTARDRARRLGRPPAKIQKVTRSIRIPTDVDAFLAEYGHTHGLLIGDVIAEAVLHFRTKAIPATSRASAISVR